MTDVLFFTDLKDATVGRHGGLVRDRTSGSPSHKQCRWSWSNATDSSAGIFTKTNIDPPVLLFRIRTRICSAPHNHDQEQEGIWKSCNSHTNKNADLRKLVKDLPGAAIGLNNEMIGGPSSFLASGKPLYSCILQVVSYFLIGSKDHRWTLIVSKCFQSFFEYFLTVL